MPPPQTAKVNVKAMLQYSRSAAFHNQGLAQDPEAVLVCARAYAPVHVHVCACGGGGEGDEQDYVFNSSRVRVCGATLCTSNHTTGAA